METVSFFKFSGFNKNCDGEGNHCHNHQSECHDFPYDIGDPPQKNHQPIQKTVLSVAWTRQTIDFDPKAPCSRVRFIAHQRIASRRTIFITVTIANGIVGFQLFHAAPCSRRSVYSGSYPVIYQVLAETLGSDAGSLCLLGNRQKKETVVGLLR